MLCRRKPPLWLKAAGTLVLLCSGAAPGLSAQTPRVERRGTFRREVLETAPTTVAFQVTGSASSRTLLQGSMELPLRWHVITPEAPFALGPAETDLRLVGVMAAAGTRAGSYLIRYHVGTVPPGNGTGTARGASDSVLFVVPIRRRLDLQLTDAPDFVAAGNPYTATFVVTNHGNEPTQVRLELESGAGLVARTKSSTVELAPDESRSIPVTVTTSRQMTVLLRHRLAIRAIATADTAASAASMSMVEVIPRTGASAVHRQFLPLRLKVRGSANNAAAPFELSGVSPIGTSGAKVAVLARGSTAPGSLFSTRDEFWVDFRSPRLDLRLGDQVYALSPLLGSGRPGIGGNGRIAIGPLVARGFVQKNRWDPSGQHTQGAFLGLRPTRAVEVGVNYFQRSATGAPLWSARAQIVPASGQVIDLEYGLGARRKGEARSVTLLGSRRHWSYEVRHLRADSVYREPFGLAAQDFANIAVRPGRLLSFEASAGETQWLGPLNGALPLSSSLQRLYRAGVGYGAVSLEYNQSRQHFTSGSAELWRSSESVRLRVGLHGKRSWLQPFAEFGRIAGDVEQQWAPFRHVGVAASLLNGRGSSATISLESYHAQKSGLIAADDHVIAGANASLMLGRATRLLIMTQGTRMAPPARQLTGLFDATLTHDLPWGHTLAARVRVIALGGAQRLRSSIFFEYSLPLRVPLRSNSTATRLDGRVYNAESRAGVANAVVRVDNRVALTDRSGRWAFTDLQPGMQTILIDPRSLSPGQVAVATAPLELQLAAGARSHYDLGVTRSARLTGRVVLYEFASNAKFAGGSTEVTEGGGVAGLVVDLVSSAGVVRRVTETDGGFDFSDLAAGQWTVRVSGTLPEQHYLERDSIDVTVSPEGSNVIQLRVLPTVRRMHMLTQRESAVTLPGAISPDAAPSPAKPAETTAGNPPGAPVVRTYVVTRFDVSLLSIARSVYGDSSFWPKIWIANWTQLASPSAIRPGQVLLIPASAPLTEEDLSEARAYQSGARMGQPWPWPEE